MAGSGEVCCVTGTAPALLQFGVRMLEDTSLGES